jgi:hypothetical protein
VNSKNLVNRGHVLPAALQAQYQEARRKQPAMYLTCILAQLLIFNIIITIDDQYLVSQTITTRCVNEGFKRKLSIGSFKRPGPQQTHEVEA